MVIIFLLGIVIFVTWGIWFIVNKIREINIISKSKKNVIEMNTYFSTMKYFKMKQVQFSIGSNRITDNCLAIDEHNKLICILEVKNNGIKEKIYKYEVLHSSELIRNGNYSVTKTSLSDDFIGGTIFGESDAMVGDPTSEKAISNNVDEIGIIVIFNDSANSVYKFNFIDSFNCMEVTRNWHGILSVIIKRNEEGRKNYL